MYENTIQMSLPHCIA